MKTKLKSNLIIFICGILALCMLTACPYKSDVPITQKGEFVTMDFIGMWIDTEELNSENPVYYNVDNPTGNEYKITENIYSEDESQYNKKYYKCHISKVGNEYFMNIKKQDADGYFLYKIEWINNEKIKVYEVTDNIRETFDNSDDLKSYIEKYKHLSFFYNKEPKIYKKTSSVDW